jgi:hypothetical protein
MEPELTTVATIVSIPVSDVSTVVAMLMFTPPQSSQASVYDWSML